MKRFTLLFAFLLLIIFIPINAKPKKTDKVKVEETNQKAKFDFQDAMNFKYIRASDLSYYGNWAVYDVVPDWGDNHLKVINTTDTSNNFVIERGASPKFSNDEGWFGTLVKGKLLEIENAKSPKDKPKAILKIWELAKKNSREYKDVTRFMFSENSKWLVYTKDETIDKDKKLKFKPLGKNISLMHLKSGTEININNVYNYTFDSLSNYFIYSISTPDGDKDGLFFRKLTEEFAPEYIIEKKEKTIYSNLTYSDTAKALAYIVSKINAEGEPNNSILKLWKPETENLTQTLIDSTKLEKDWIIYHNNDLKFTKDGSRIWIGLKPMDELYAAEPYKIKFNDTTLSNLDTLQANSNLLLWHYRDPRIKTYDQTNWNSNKDNTYPAIYDISARTLTKIADKKIEEVDRCNNPDWTIGYDVNPYKIESTWTYDRFDLYKINLKNGERKLIALDLQEPAHLSPTGKYVIYYKDSLWNIYYNNGDSVTTFTKTMQFPMYDDENDTPDKAPSYGFAGWMENDVRFMINDKYDIWAFFSEIPIARVNLTGTYGREFKIKFRIIPTDYTKDYYSPKDTLLISGYHTKLKWQNLYYQDFKIIGSEKMTFHKEYFTNFYKKAKGNDAALFSIENFAKFPDLLFTKDVFKQIDTTIQISDLGKQLDKYNWGKAELISWKDSQGNELQGFVMKPENYDSTKKYPMIIHYYEKFSDYYLRFQRPAVNHRPSPTIYLNDGYVMFYPDIVFKVGYPGYSAVDALTTGSQKLIDMGIADPKAIGLQGHSWSGYQTAFIITQTDFFKAACAGAPVANMTSAYSGIRLGTGIARQFQYEKQQSRIGGNLWDSLDNYIKNSPIFQAKGIHTPLLVEFGDIDDAVPWEQGIELFLAMRRLSQPVFMLQYENEPHILRKYYNKVDYAIRMKEFFDYYLKGAPEPDWIKNGIPYKGN